MPRVACERGRRSGAARRATWLLRRRRDGDQGVGVDGAHVRAARLLLPRDRPQQDRRRPVRRAGRRVRRRHRRRAAGLARSCCRRTDRRPRSSPRPVLAAATWSTRCARSSPRSTTRSRCAPRRASASSTSATRVTRRRSARWRSPRLSISRVESVAEVDALPAVRPAGRPPGADHAVPSRLVRRRRSRQGEVPGRVDARPQRPVLRHHQPAVGADGDGVEMRCDRGDRLVELVQHPSAREAGDRGRLPAGVPRQPRRRAARRPARHGRRHRRGVGARGAGRRDPAAPQPRATASSRSRSPTRTSTSRRRATSGAAERRSAPPRPPCSVDRSPIRRR